MGPDDHKLIHKLPQVADFYGKDLLRSMCYGELCTMV